MFGHQDIDQNENQTVGSEPPADGTLSQGASPTQIDDTPSTPQDETPSAPAVSSATTSDFVLSEPHQIIAPHEGSPTPHDNSALVSSPTTEDLLSLKQKALQQLSPLVGHLDQTPEEKFRTTMMMIQASDDQTLIKTAYDAAQAIGDEKARAQALLDIVNEINYFTQHQEPAV